jgi:hypothetical protein
VFLDLGEADPGFGVGVEQFLDEVYCRRRRTFELVAGVAVAGKDLPELIEVALGQLLVVLVLLVGRFEGLQVHHHFEEHVAAGEHVDFVAVIDAVLQAVGEFGGVAFCRADGL